jgi:outer membrane protein assembly factor BamB
VTKRLLTGTIASTILMGGCSTSNRTGNGVPTATGNSVLERNNHASRDGHFVQPTLTKAAAATLARDTAFIGTFAGNMWASPLYLENGPGGKGVFFVVTTGNDVMALDETTGAVVWTHNIGPSPTNSGAGCGNIHPIGILSTPVIDRGAVHRPP